MTNQIQEEIWEEVPVNQFHRKEARNVFSGIGLALAVFLLVTTILQIGASVLIGLEIIRLGSHAFDKTMLISMGMMYFLGFPAFLLVSRKIPAAEKIPVRKWSFWKLSGTFIISLGTIYVGNLFSQLLMYTVSLITGEPMFHALDEVINNMSIGMILLLTVIFAPVVEEIIFRKVLIDRMIPYGEGVAVVVSGVLFGLVHGNFYQFFYACALGMIFAYMYVKTGRLSYTIIFHMLINFTGSVLPMLLMGILEASPVVGMLLFSTFGFFIIGFIVTGIALLVCFRKSITLAAGSAPIPKGSRFRVIFCNAGMLLYVLICVLMFAFS